MVGYVDFGDQVIGVYFTLFGSQVGPQLKANLKTGFTYKLNLGIGSGQIRIYVDGSAVKLYYNLKVLFSNKSDTITLFNV